MNRRPFEGSFGPPPNAEDKDGGGEVSVKELFG